MSVNCVNSDMCNTRVLATSTLDDSVHFLPAPVFPVADDLIQCFLFSLSL